MRKKLLKKPNKKEPSFVSKEPINVNNGSIEET